jgi:hypothetical protein
MPLTRGRANSLTGALSKTKSELHDTRGRQVQRLLDGPNQVHRAVHNHIGIPIVAAINPQNSNRLQRPNDALSTLVLAGAHQPNRMPTYTNIAE